MIEVLPQAKRWADRKHPTRFWRRGPADGRTSRPCCRSRRRPHGVGITQAFAALGATVTVSEAGDLGDARKCLTDSLFRAGERGTLVDPLDVVAGRVAFVASVTELPEGTRLLVESAPEDPGPKRRVLADAERVVSDDAVMRWYTTSRLGAAARQDARGGARFAGFRHQPPRRAAPTGSDPDARGGRGRLRVDRPGNGIGCGFYDWS